MKRVVWWLKGVPIPDCERETINDFLTSCVRKPRKVDCWFFHTYFQTRQRFLLWTSLFHRIRPWDHPQNWDESWDNLCQNKSQGGICFMNVADFNTALLANQLWRLITVLDSMFVNVFRGIFFYSKCNLWIR